MATARNIPQAHADLKDGRWEKGKWGKGGVELRGKTLGILGLGRIGFLVAEDARGLGMDVLAYDPFVPAEKFHELGLKRADNPDKIYREADFITVHLPKNAETLGFIGDEVRKDRTKLPKSDLLPWLTPGDAGAFTGEALRCAMLECFLNGARGIHFWSGRYWDAEYLLAYNQAVRAVAPIEDIIVDGKLYDGAKVAAPARVSGMINGNDVALLVGEYYGHGPATVNVTLTAPAAGPVVDTETDEKIGSIGAGPGQKIAVKLDGHRSRVLWIRPR